MALLKEGQVCDDIYVNVSGHDELPAAGAIIVSVEQWQNRRDELLARDEPIGVVLRSDEKPDLIEADLSHFSVIALDFPVFRDGRAYSYARRLRRMGWDGELRAVGEVLLEQLHYMHRVGFNSFLISDEDAVSAWETACADFTVWYQPSADDRDTVIERRHSH